MKILDSKVYSMVCLNETHALELPPDLISHCNHTQYNILNLPARRSNNVGRYCGGTVVFVKRHMALSSVLKECFDWGECVSVTIN